MADPEPTGQSHVTGAVFLALGATAGAMGAHALESVLSPDRLESWITASLYLLVMGAALVGAQRQHNSPSSQRALQAVAAGTALFSASIMALVVLATLDLAPGVRRVLGPMTPIGGVLMIGGWVVWAWGQSRQRGGHSSKHL